MDESPVVRRLLPDDASALLVLRREALETNPLAFGSSPSDDRARSLEFLRGVLAEGQEQAVFGSFEQSKLTGMVGVLRATSVKARHIGNIWGMYVTPAGRGKGIGKALLDAAIELARGWSGVERLSLCVTTDAAVALAMYEAAGFRAWGHEPRALAWEGQFVDEIHLSLDLRHPPGIRSSP